MDMLSLETASCIDKTFKNRWRTLMSVDDVIANTIATTKELGVFDNTYFMYTSDRKTGRAVRGYFSWPRRLYHSHTPQNVTSQKGASAHGDGRDGSGKRTQKGGGQASGLVRCAHPSRATKQFPAEPTLSSGGSRSVYFACTWHPSLSQVRLRV